MKVELFYTPGCAKCAGAATALKAAAEAAMPGVEWSEVNVLVDLDRAVDLGVLTLPALAVASLVLGPLLENNLRKSLILSRGDFTIFVERPISVACLIVAALILLAPVLPSFARKREVIALDSE